MGTIFYKVREGIEGRGCWVHESKGVVRDTFNRSFAEEMKRLRDAGVNLKIYQIVDQLIQLKDSDRLQDAVTVAEYAEQYIQDRLADYRDKPNRTERKIKNYHKRMKKFLSNFVAMYGDKRLGEVTAEDIKSFYRKRRSGVRKMKDGVKNIEGTTVFREVTAIRAMYNYALRFGRFKGINPVAQSKIKHEDNRRERVLSVQEQERLLAVCDRELKDFVTLLLNTGCRLDEILSLQWNWVDLTERVLHLPEYITKNDKPRDVRVNQVCISLLRERRLITGNSVYVFPSDLSKAGHLMGPYRRWYKVCKQAGISDLRFHDLRHTCGSRLKELSVDGSAVQKILGHSDFKTTTRYIHVKDSVQDACELLGITYFATKSDEKTA